MTRITVWGLGLGLVLLLAAGSALAQKDNDKDGPSSWVYFTVVKDENGKPVRNAAVIMHPVSAKGKQVRGGLELKTSSDGKTDFDGIPYGMLRVQVLAPGFQTYGEDFDIEKATMEITIKLKRPGGQYSVYDDHAPKPDPGSDTKKPN